MESNVHPWRVLGKAVLLFVIANLLFAWFDPPVQKLSAYNTLFPGRLRFPFGRGLEDYDLTVDELDAIFAAHVLTAAPKPADELRVVVLGDSSIWGELLTARDTLPAQLDAAGLTCGGRTLRFYNLGYPHPFALKDLVILQQAMAYEPDVILWPLTLNTLRIKDPNPFMLTNAAQAGAIVEQYYLPYDLSLLQTPAPSFGEQTLVGQRKRLARLFLEQWLGFYWAAGLEPDFAAKQIPSVENDLSDKVNFGELKPPANVQEVLLFETLEVGMKIAGQVPVLFVNEPMFIATGKNSDLLYNEFYPRWAYDQYRALLMAYTAKAGVPYLDAWNALPNTSYTDTALHLSPAGEAAFAELLIPFILENACAVSP